VGSNGGNGSRSGSATVCSYISVGRKATADLFDSKRVLDVDK